MFPGKIFLDDDFQDLNERRDKFNKDLINFVRTHLGLSVFCWKKITQGLILFRFLEDCISLNWFALDLPSNEMSKNPFLKLVPI